MKKRKFRDTNTTFEDSKKSANGITLIALVMTIIIMLILAGITLNFIIGENSIIEKAKNSQKIQDIASITEKLEVEKGETWLDHFFGAKLEEYVKQIKKNKIIEQENILDPENIENGKCYIRVDGKYIFLLEQDGENIKITYVEDPLILKLITTVKSNKIEVIANIYNENLEELSSEGAEYEYSIKKENEDYGEVVEKADKNHTYENLKKNTKYCIKVKAKKDGKEIELEKWLTTEILGINSFDITHILEPDDEWVNTDLKVTAQINSEDYSIYTSRDGKNWDATATQVFTENGTMYEKIVDSSGQESDDAQYKSYVVTNIDKLEPSKCEIVSSNVTTKGFTINVTAEDAAATESYGCSGIKEYTYYYKKSDETEYVSSSQTGTSKTYDGLKSGTYNVYVVATDKAKNTKKSNELEVKLETIMTPMIGSSSPENWTKGDVTVTLPTTEGYTTRYTIDGSMPSKTSTEYTGEFTVSSNCVVNYIYTDGTNIGGAATVNVTNIDKTIPTMNSISAGSVSWSGSTGTVTITGEATDTAAGICAYQFSTDPNLTENSSGWQTISATTSKISQKTNVTSTNTYFFYVKDQAGNYNKNSVNVTISDTNLPTISLSADATTGCTSIGLTGTSKDTGSGIVAYAWTTTNSTPSKWTTVAQTNGQITQKYSATSNTKYYFWTKDGIGNINKAEVSITGIGHKPVNGGTASVHTKCSVCGITLSSSHTFTSSEVAIAATCTTKGTTKYKCGCGYSKTIQDIPVIAHTPQYGGTASVHTKCSSCGVTLSSSHSFTSSQVVVQPTCTTKGTTKYICGCGYSKTEQDIPYPGHAWSNAVNDDTYYCTRCGATTAKSANTITLSGPTSKVVDAAHGMSYTYTISSTLSTVNLRIKHNSTDCGGSTVQTLTKGNSVSVHGLKFAWSGSSLTITGNNNDVCNQNLVGMKFYLYSGGKNTNYKKTISSDYYLCSAPMVNSNASSLADVTGNNKVVYFFNCGSASNNGRDWVNGINPDDSRFFNSSGTQLTLRLYYKGSSNLRCYRTNKEWGVLETVTLNGLNTSNWSTMDIVLNDKEGLHFDSSTKWDAGGIYSIIRAEYW